MDPYLERHDLWPDVHNRLITSLADAITPVVAPKYYVGVESRSYVIKPDRDRYDELITAIELLSPVNKIDSHGRFEYEQKRYEVLMSRTNYVLVLVVQCSLLRPSDLWGFPNCRHVRF